MSFFLAVIFMYRLVNLNDGINSNFKLSYSKGMPAAFRESAQDLSNALLYLPKLFCLTLFLFFVPRFLGMQ